MDADARRSRVAFGAGTEIDRSEAGKLFKVVREPNGPEGAAARRLGAEAISTTLRAPEILVRYIETEHEYRAVQGE